MHNLFVYLFATNEHFREHFLEHFDPPPDTPRTGVERLAADCEFISSDG